MKGAYFFLNIFYQNLTVSQSLLYTNIDLFLPRVRISDTFDSLFMVSFCVVSLWAFMCFVCLYKTPNERKQMTVRVFLYVCSIGLNLLIFFVYFPQMGCFFYFLALEKGLLLLNKNATHALRIYPFLNLKQFKLPFSSVSRSTRF